eukprot:TRINITY_DN92832_c0_g1_i1.p1 TRINITY_DN92832_c0_g1~~TRINITY_DN92832_c0_g1_i1.p1  ORF type:complete len:145 (-),score=25.66 TRINITY_DN92832_c0_g1_i1:301-735(-)
MSNSRPFVHIVMPFFAALYLQGCGCSIQYDCCAENGGSGHCDASSRPCCKSCAADERVTEAGDCEACERGKYSKKGSVKDDGATACSSCEAELESACLEMSGCTWKGSCMEKDCVDATDYSTCVNKLSSSCTWNDTGMPKCNGL